MTRHTWRLLAAAVALAWPLAWWLADAPGWAAIGACLFAFYCWRTT